MPAACGLEQQTRKYLLHRLHRRARQHHQQIAGAGAGDKNFAAGQKIVIAFFLSTCFQRCGIRTCARLGQAIAAETESMRQASRPLFTNRCAAPGANHPRHHVVDGDVGGGAGAAGGQLFEE